MDTENLNSPYAERGENMFPNTTIITNQTIYPTISDKLIEALNTDFPNELPKEYVTEFELGILLGQRQVIDKLICEKEYNEKESEEDES